ncbi:MAG: hypothetical protein R2697_07635 [Ilumatobacteraceae bacterium]
MPWKTDGRRPFLQDEPARVNIAAGHLEAEPFVGTFVTPPDRRPTSLISRAELHAATPAAIVVSGHGQLRARP